jgi:hypothetical protein
MGLLCHTEGVHGLFDGIHPDAVTGHDGDPIAVHPYLLAVSPGHWA